MVAAVAAFAARNAAQMRSVDVSGPIWLARDGDLISVDAAGIRMADKWID